MAIKYGRPDNRGREADAHGHPGRFFGRTLEPKRRLLYIYIGILLFCLLMLLFNGLGLQKSLSLLPSEEQVGTVVSKAVVYGQHIVTVAIERADEEPAVSEPVRLLGEARVDRKSYDSVSVGTPLLVTYQLNENRSAIVVRGLRAVGVDGEPPADGGFRVELAPGTRNDAN